MDTHMYNKIWYIKDKRVRVLLTCVLTTQQIQHPTMKLIHCATLFLRLNVQIR